MLLVLLSVSSLYHQAAAQETAPVIDREGIDLSEVSDIPEVAKAKDLQPLVESINRGVDWLSLDKTTPLIRIPDEAIVVPYRVADALQEDENQHIYVPLNQYRSLWETVRAKESIPKPESPVSYVIKGASYQTILNDGEQLELVGTIELESFSKDSQTVSLPFSGGILKSILVNDAPASVHLEGGTIQLLLRTRGKYKLDLSILFPLKRQGGWRFLNGIVPSALGSNLDAIVPQSGTEVRAKTSSDVRPGPTANNAPQQAAQQFVPPNSNTGKSVILLDTEKDQQTVSIPIYVDGNLNLQWRSKIVQAVVDQGLQVDSSHLFDIQPGGLRWIWNPTLSFRSGQRDSFRLIVPSNALIESISGENVRGWKKETIDGKHHLDVTLLKPATGKESFTIRASLAALDFANGSATIDVPSAEIEEP